MINLQIITLSWDYWTHHYPWPNTLSYIIYLSCIEYAQYLLLIVNICTQKCSLLNFSKLLIMSQNCEVLTLIVFEQLLSSSVGILGYTKTYNFQEWYEKLYNYFNISVVLTSSFNLNILQISFSAATYNLLLILLLLLPLLLHSRLTSEENSVLIRSLPSRYIARRKSFICSCCQHVCFGTAAQMAVHLTLFGLENSSSHDCVSLLNVYSLKPLCCRFLTSSATRFVLCCVSILAFYL